MGNKSLIKYYVLLGVCFGFILLIIFGGKKQEQAVADLEFEASYKEQIKAGQVFIEFLDSTRQVYSNYEYGFSVDFPDNWIIDKGVSEHTIIRAMEGDSIITCSVNVIELNEIKNKNVTAWELFDSKTTDIDKIFKEKISKSLNSEIYAYNSKKTYLDNRKVLKIEYNYQTRSEESSVEMKGVQYSAFINPYIYTISLSAPGYFYDLDSEIFREIIKGFKFIKRKNYNV